MTKCTIVLWMRLLSSKYKKNFNACSTCLDEGPVQRQDPTCNIVSRRGSTPSSIILANLHRPHRIQTGHRHHHHYHRHQHHDAIIIVIIITLTIIVIIITSSTPSPIIPAQTAPAALHTNLKKWNTKKILFFYKSQLFFVSAETTLSSKLLEKHHLPNSLKCEGNIGSLFNL